MINDKDKKKVLYLTRPPFDGAPSTRSSMEYMEMLSTNALDISMSSNNISLHCICWKNQQFFSILFINECRYYKFSWELTLFLLQKTRNDSKSSLDSLSPTASFAGFAALSHWSQKCGTVFVCVIHSWQKDIYKCEHGLNMV